MNPFSKSAALALRKKKFVEEFKILDADDGDEWDELSSHVAAVYNGQLVGYARLIPGNPRPLDYLFEYPAFIDNGRDWVEISRLCAEPWHVEAVFHAINLIPFDCCISAQSDIAYKACGVHWRYKSDPIEYHGQRRVYIEDKEYLRQQLKPLKPGYMVGGIVWRG